jgi:DNA-binding NarL/FixJ family response regulator
VSAEVVRADHPPMDFEARARAHRHGLMRVAGLTDREVQVLEGIADGKTNREIGEALFLEENTIKSHARHLFRKIGADDRAHAVAIGFRAGWLV